MKLLKVFSGDEYIVEDDEALNIVAIKNTPNSKAMIQLRCGAFVATSAIASISNPPLLGMAHGQYPLSKDGRSYMRDGQRVYLESYNHVEYIPDPLYVQKAKFQLTGEQPKELSDRKKMLEVRKEDSSGFAKSLNMGMDKK